MRPFVRLVRLQTLAFALLAACAVGASVAQDVVLADRGPRFFLASSRAEPVEIEASSSALLRRVVSLTLDQPTVGRLLAAIELQTGLRFAYDRDLLPGNQPVALRAEAITVAAALTAILADADLDVLISAGRQVGLIRRKPRPAVQGGTVVGRVSDAKTTAPIAGATMVVEGTSRSASSGADGRYRIAELAAGTYTVRARYIG